LPVEGLVTIFFK